MELNRLIEDLLSQTCPPIRYRIKKEILGGDPNLGEMKKLQREVLKDPLVSRNIGLFRPEGFSGSHFHSQGAKSGEEALEVALRILFEKGVEFHIPELQKALSHLEEGPPFYDKEIHRIGGFLDKSGLGGSSLIRAYLLSRGGRESSPLVKEEIRKVLETFRFLKGVKDLGEVCQEYRGKLVFKPGALWPGIYHFRLLAFNPSWASSENLELVSQAIENLIDLGPSPFIYLKVGSQLVAPPTVFALELTPDLEDLEEQEWGQWFERMELLSRMGIVSLVPALEEQRERLSRILQEGYPAFKEFKSNRFWTYWSAYSGLALEPSWAFQEARTRDVLFRSLLVLHYSRTR
ncbi:MAG: hypothetical protein NUV68_03575 [Caldiserica bacterium]|jgi:hypothetical protein|nr:hypothetical protein [Caldisericota bacterium]MDH7562377.1 hypothetical protein [Caldisericota bacterium]